MYEKAKIHVERIPDLLKQFPEDLSFKADISDPKFIYQRKKKTKRGEVENPIEVVKKVLIGIKGLLDQKKEDIIKKYMFPEEKKQIEEEIKEEIDKILLEFEEQKEEEPIDE